MISFDQTVNLTIHSKLSRYISAKMSPFSFGHVRKGTIGTPAHSNRKHHDKKSMERQEMEIQTGKKISHEIRPMENMDPIESKIYPNILFTLKPNSASPMKQCLPMHYRNIVLSDPRNHTLFVIVTNIMMEIDFSLAELKMTVSDDKIQYNIYFAESSITPISECCKYPIALMLHYQHGGCTVCLNQHCQNNLLFQFRLSVDECQDLWQDMTAKKITDQETNIRKTISRLITTGKYRRINMAKQISKPDNSKHFLNNTEHTNSQDDYQSQPVRVNTAKLAELMQLNRALIGDHSHQHVDQTQLVWKPFDHRRSMSNEVATKTNIFNKKFRIGRTLKKN